MKSQNNFKKRLISVAIASVLTGLGSHAAANDIALTSAITITNNDTPAFSGSATVGTNGIVGNIDGVPTYNEFFIPSFSFTLANALAQANQTPGPYTFKVGVIITNNGNVGTANEQRFEAYLGQLQMEFVNGVLVGRIPAQNLEVKGRDGVTFGATSLSNAATNGPVSISGGTVTFNGNSVVNRLKAADPTFNLIFNSFNAGATYTYKIVIEEVGGSVNRFGLSSGGVFTPIPRLQTSCGPDANSALGEQFKLNINGSFASNFSKAYHVQGQFRVGGVGSFNNLTALGCETAPVAGTAALNADYETQISGQLPAATDAQGDTVTYSLVSATNGSATVSSSGAYTFTPATGFSSSQASFVYRVSDGQLSTDYTVTVDVGAAPPTNAAPVASAGSTSVGFGGTVTGQLTATDSNAGDTLTYLAGGTAPTKGSVNINSNGSFTYTANVAAGSTGTDTFSFIARDSQNADSNEEIVTVTIGANGAPQVSGTSIPLNDELTVGQTYSNVVSAIDPDNNPLTYVLGSTVDGLNFNSNGTFTFTPTAPGPASFTFTATDGVLSSPVVTVTFTNVVAAIPTNRAPIPGADGVGSTKFRIPLQSGLATPSDPDGDSAFTFVVVTPPAEGTLDLNASTGAFTYTPGQQTTGAQSFSYTVSDGKENGTSAPATVTIDVGPAIPPTATVSIANPTRTDSDGKIGEQGATGIAGTASDDTSVASVRWLVNGAQVSSSTAPNLNLTPTFDFATDGTFEVVLEATDNVGLVGASAPATIRIQPRVFPVVNIIGGNRKVIDSDGVPGEEITVIGTASDPDGPELAVKSQQWLLNSSPVEGATGLTATFRVPDGVTNTIELIAEDTQGLKSTIPAKINVEVAPFKIPVVSSLVGPSIGLDTDGLPGEALTFTATATDEDGKINTYRWSVNGAQVAETTTATTSLRVPDTVNLVSSTVSVVAVDNVGKLSASLSVNVDVRAPQAPLVQINEDDIIESVGVSGAIVRTLTANAFDPDSNVANVTWTSSGTGISVASAGNTATVTITPPGTGTVTATVRDGVNLTGTDNVTVDVKLLNIPVVAIVGGSRTVDDTDQTPGVVLPVTATATTTQPTIGGIIASTWEVNGEPAGTGLEASLPLAVGPNTVKFSATATGGEVRSTEAVITVKSAAPNILPTISISGPSSFLDTDGKAGEIVTFSATASDPDFGGTNVAGPVPLIKWVVNGETVSARGESAQLTLANGSSTVQAIAIDKSGGETTSAPITVTVGEPAAPTGFRVVAPTATVVDTDGKAGEVVKMSVVDIANASQYIGGVTAQWSVGGTVVATGNEADVPLPADGDNTVTLTLRNSINRTATATTTVNVAAPVAPVAIIVGGGSRNLPDSDSRPGENISLFGQATDADGPLGAVKSVQWLLNGNVVSNTPALDVRLDDNPAGHQIVFRATDIQGLTAEATAVVTVPTFTPPPTDAQVNAGAQAQRDTATQLAQLITSNPQAAAEQARAAALAAAAEAERLRRGTEAGSVSNSAIASGLGAMSESTRVSAQAGEGSTNQQARNEINQQAKDAIVNSGLLLERLAENSVVNNSTLSLEEEQQVQQATSNLLDTTASVARNVSTTDELLDVVQAANRITESNQRLGIPASPELVQKTTAASVEIASKVVEQVLAELGGSNLQPDEIRAALSENPNALQAVIDSALKVPPTTSKTQAQRNQEAEQSAGQNPPAGLVQRLAAASGIATNPSTVVVNGVSALQAILNLFGGGTSGLEALTVTMLDANGRIASVSKIESGAAQIKVDDVTGLVTLSLPGETYAGAIVGVKSVPSTVPTGIRFRADGRGLIVNGGFAIEIAPAPISLVRFINAVERAGFPFRMNPNATITLEVGNGERFSGTFAYDNLTGIDLAACGDLSFIEPTGALNSAGYAFGVRCANGAVQHVVPFIESSTFNDSVRAFGLTPSTDRNTGFVTVPTVGVFKPNFFVLAPTAAERVFHAANKDVFGNAVQYLDANGDGKLDVKLITATGTQLLYGVN